MIRATATAGSNIQQLSVFFGLGCSPNQVHAPGFHHNTDIPMAQQLTPRDRAILEAFFEGLEATEDYSGADDLARIRELSAAGQEEFVRRMDERVGIVMPSLH